MVITLIANPALLALANPVEIGIGTDAFFKNSPTTVTTKLTFTKTPAACGRDLEGNL